MILVDKIIKKGDKNLLLSIINNNNQRRYLGVKIKLNCQKKLFF